MSDQELERMGHSYEIYLTELSDKELQDGTTLNRRLSDILSVIKDFGKGAVGYDETLVCLDEALSIIDDGYFAIKEDEDPATEKEFLFDKFLLFSTSVVDDFFIEEDEADHEWFGERYQGLVEIEETIKAKQPDETKSLQLWSAFLKIVTEMMQTIQNDKKAETELGKAHIEKFFK